MKKTARRYKWIQIFVRKLIPSFLISFIIVSIITAWFTTVFARSMDNLNDNMGDIVSERIYSVSSEFGNVSPNEDVMFKNYLDFVMTLYSGGYDSVYDEHLGQSFVLLCDPETNQITAGPQKNIFLINTDGKKAYEVYKADESVEEKLLEIREKHPDAGFKVHAAYTGENGKFIPEKVEVREDIKSENVDFSDTDKKDYKYTELNEKANIQFMMFEGYSGDISELSERIVSESKLISPEYTLNTMFNSEPVNKKMNIHIGDKKYHLYYGSEGSFFSKSFNSSEGIVSMLVKTLGLTLICALIWSFQKYRELKVHYDSEDFRKDLTNTMAHDLKTPLMAASGYAENLLNGINPEKSEHYTKSILENIKYMDTIVSDVLELSKLESGSEILKKTSVSLRTLAENIADKYADAVSERSLSINIIGDGEAHADESLMKRSLENLINNAVKYSSEGSEIKVTLSESSITVENRYSGKEISDTNSLMKPFVKGDVSRSSKKGSGLGLSIVKNISDMHGFRFKLSSADSVFKAEITLKK